MSAQRHASRSSLTVCKCGKAGRRLHPCTRLTPAPQPNRFINHPYARTRAGHPQDAGGERGQGRHRPGGAPAGLPLHGAEQGGQGGAGAGKGGGGPRGQGRAGRRATAGGAAEVRAPRPALCGTPAISSAPSLPGVLSSFAAYVMLSKEWLAQPAAHMAESGTHTAHFGSLPAKPLCHFGPSPGARTERAGPGGRRDPGQHCGGRGGAGTVQAQDPAGKPRCLHALPCSRPASTLLPGSLPPGRPPPSSPPPQPAVRAPPGASLLISRASPLSPAVCHRGGHHHPAHRRPHTAGA